MWTIQQITVTGGAPSDAYMSDGKPVVGTRRGPEGASFRLYIKGRGMLDITDTGHQTGGYGYWQLVFNNQIYWYDGDGAPVIWIGSDGFFRVTGNGHTITGRLLPLPEISESDMTILQEMRQKNLIPYSAPLQPGQRPYADVEAIAKNYFSFSKYWSELGLTIYDWTTADFFRIIMYHLYRYTAVAGQPLADTNIIQGIWTSNWPPYTPRDPYFMASMLMKPSYSVQEVAEQYHRVKSQMRIYMDALMRLTHSAMYAMPRTSTLSKPMLYSGQVDISNLGESAMAVHFRQYPGNAGPVGAPMGMPIDEALQGFMEPGSLLTVKDIISFTDSADDARKYSNGIIIEMSPPRGVVVWPQCPYITPLSNGSDKTEYTYPPGSQWKITGSRKETHNRKGYTVLSVTDSPV